MKNKIICLIFAMVLVVCALASCGGGGGDDTKKDPSIPLNWDTTELLFQMNMSSNGKELSSGVKRYYAGEDNKGEKIDELISDRNDKAYADAKVTVKYSYLEDNNADYVWGKNADRIFTQASSGGQNTPDMFCNFAYDMTCAAIKGAFANLYSTSYDSNGNDKGENYFRFTEADYNPTITDFFDSKAGEGYFKAYMDSLSLSNGKAYCLASDYCTDLVRSFLVIPVNVSLLGEVKVDGTNVVDILGDGKYDTYDFYTMVWNNEWTYDKIAAISGNVYQNNYKDNDTAGATTNIGDRIGFAAGVGSGLTASGLLYTTDVKIIDKGTLSYPANNQTLNDVAAALNKLFSENKSNGVCTVSVEQAKALGYNGTHAELDAIRDQFTDKNKNNILFGGIVTVGSLEDSDYQGMKANGGFGIVPVPLYKTGIEYKTLVHNLARIVGISVVTGEFEMCTAFLNEVSTNSSNVLEQYYTKNLAAVVGGGTAGENNVQMLTYIRNHVNDCFDKTYEDMVSFYKSDTATATWHNTLMAANYQMGDFSTVYGTMASSKTTTLKEIETAWKALSK
ncbi:MAG: hypothetical protein IJW03_05755 [Clostridia bacterium]|nr:hypothetical protein [Clostridia bacterium]